MDARFDVGTGWVAEYGGGWCDGAAAVSGERGGLDREKGFLRAIETCNLGGLALAQTDESLRTHPVLQLAVLALQPPRSSL